MLTVLAPGPVATVQDRGRRGWAAIGVTTSGAADRAAADLANRLVGNDPDAAVVEVTAGGLRLRAGRTVLVAVTGAPAPVSVDGRAAPLNAPLTLAAGEVLTLGLPAAGLRSYVAVRGGVAVPPVLGSRSTDTLSGLGPAPLAAGDVLPVGRPEGGEVSGASGVPAPAGGPLPVRLGPRDDWFTAAARERLVRAEWTVRAESDRVGLRLDGPRLERAVPGELPSEPVLPGAVQVPPDGRPIVFGPDAPVTGGYPVIAVVLQLSPVAQLRPGDRVRFSSAAGSGRPTPARRPPPPPGS